MSAMSKRTRILLIVAGSLVFGGMLLSVVAFVSVGAHIDKLSTVGQWQQYRQVFSANPHAIQQNLIVHSNGSDVRIEQGVGNDFEVNYWKNDSQDLSATENDEGLTLSITQKPLLSFLQLDFSFQDHTTLIKLPQGYKGSIAIDAGDGNVALSNLEGLSDIDISLSDGSASLDNIASQSLSCTATSGMIKLDTIEARRITSSLTNGNASLSHIRECDALSVSSSSGTVCLNDISTDQIQAYTHSGSVHAALLDAHDIDLQAANGSISASLVGDAQDYNATTSKKSGSIKLPEHMVQGSRQLNAQVDSGSITISFGGFSG